MKRGEKSLGKKLKCTLWIAIILIIFAASYCVTAASVVLFKKVNGYLNFNNEKLNAERFGYYISDWKGSKGDQNGRKSLIQTNVTELLGAKVGHFEGDDPIKYKNAICMSHGVSNAVTTAGIYYVKTVIDIDYDSEYKSVIIKTYNSKGNKQVKTNANTEKRKRKSSPVSLCYTSE